VQDGRNDTQDFDTKVTPRIKSLLCELIMEHSSISFLRGDLESVKRLMLYKSRVDETWPGLWSDAGILANLERAFPIVADCNMKMPFSEYGARLKNAGIADLGSPYQCRLLSCPRHPGLCDRGQPAIAVARVPLDLGQWLKACAGESIRIQSRKTFYSIFSNGRGMSPHDMILWHFHQPRYKVSASAGAVEQPSGTEQYIAAAQVLSFGVKWQMIGVYDYHEDVAEPCQRALPGDTPRQNEPGSEEALASGRTPGCPACLREVEWTSLGASAVLAQRQVALPLGQTCQTMSLTRAWLVNGALKNKPQ
jgi:hypothetical protein